MIWGMDVFLGAQSLEPDPGKFSLIGEIAMPESPQVRGYVTVAA